MTPEERQMLTDLATKIAQTPSPAHDAEAEEFIRTRIGNRADALYLMTQTVLIQNMAIEHAQQEIRDLQQRQASPAAPQSSGSFLGRGSGWGPSAPPPQQPQQAPYGAQGSYGPPNTGSPGMGQSGMGSFLRSAGTTAAGIAAGALAFEGIRSMFGGVEHLFGFGNQQGMSSGFLGNASREEIINNYYDSPDQGGSSVADDLGPDDSVNYDDSNVADDSLLDDSSSSDYDDSSSSDDLV